MDTIQIKFDYDLWVNKYESNLDVLSTRDGCKVLEVHLFTSLMKAYYPLIAVVEYKLDHINCYGYTVNGQYCSTKDYDLDIIMNVPIETTYLVLRDIGQNQYSSSEAESLDHAISIMEDCPDALAILAITNGKVSVYTSR